MKEFTTEKPVFDIDIKVPETLEQESIVDIYDDSIYEDEQEDIVDIYDDSIYGESVDTVVNKEVVAPEIITKAEPKTDKNISPDYANLPTEEFVNLDSKEKAVAVENMSDYDIDKVNQEILGLAEETKAKIVRESTLKAEKEIDAKAEVLATELVKKEIKEDTPEEEKKKKIEEKKKEIGNNKFLYYLSNKEEIEANKNSLKHLAIFSKQSMRLEIPSITDLANSTIVDEYYGGDVNKLKTDYQKSLVFYNNLQAPSTINQLEKFSEYSEKRKQDIEVLRGFETKNDAIRALNVHRKNPELYKAIEDFIKYVDEREAQQSSKSRGVTPRLGYQDAYTIDGKEYIGTTRFKNIYDRLLFTIDNNLYDDDTLEKIKADGRIIAYNPQDLAITDLEERGVITMTTAKADEHFIRQGLKGYQQMADWDLDKESMFHRFTVEDDLNIGSSIIGSFMNLGLQIGDVYNSYRRTIYAMIDGDEVYENESYKSSLATSRGRQALEMGSTIKQRNEPFSMHSGMLAIINSIPQIAFAMASGKVLGGLTSGAGEIIGSKMLQRIAPKVASAGTIVPLIGFAGKDYYDEAIEKGFSARESAVFSTVGTAILALANWKSTWMLDSIGKKKLFNSVKTEIGKKLIVNSGVKIEAPRSILVRGMNLIPGINKLTKREFIKNFSLKNYATLGFREEMIQESTETIGEHLNKNIFAAYAEIFDSEGTFENVTKDGYLANFFKEVAFAGVIGGFSGAIPGGLRHLKTGKMSDMDKGKITSLAQVVAEGKEDLIYKALGELEDAGALGQKDQAFISYIESKGENNQKSSYEDSIAFMNKKAVLNEVVAAKAILGPNTKGEVKDVGLNTEYKQVVTDLVDVMHKHNMTYVDYDTILTYKSKVKGKEGQEDTEKTDVDTGLKLFNDGKKEPLTKEDFEAIKKLYQRLDDFTTGRVYNDYMIMKAIDASSSRYFKSKEFLSEEEAEKFGDNFFLRYMEAVNKAKGTHTTRIEEKIKYLKGIKHKAQKLPSNKELFNEEHPNGDYNQLVRSVQELIEKDGGLTETTKKKVLALEEKMLLASDAKAATIIDLNNINYNKGLTEQEKITLSQESITAITNKIIGENKYLSPEDFKRVFDEYSNLPKNKRTITQAVKNLQEVIGTTVTAIDIRGNSDTESAINNLPVIDDINNQIEKLEQDKDLDYSFLENIINIDSMESSLRTFSGDIVAFLDEVQANMDETGDYENTDGSDLVSLMNKIALHKDFLDINTNMLMNIGDIQRTLTKIQEDKFLKTKKRLFRKDITIKAFKNDSEGHISKSYSKVFYDPNRLDFLNKKEQHKNITPDELKELDILKQNHKTLMEPSESFVEAVLKASNENVTQEEITKEWEGLINNVREYNKLINQGKRETAVEKYGSNPVLDFITKKLSKHNFADVLAMSKEIMTYNSISWAEKQAETIAEKRYAEIKSKTPNSNEETVIQTDIDLLINEAFSPSNTDQAKIEVEAAFSRLFPKKSFAEFKKQFYGNYDFSEKLEGYLNIPKELNRIDEIMLFSNGIDLMSNYIQSATNYREILDYDISNVEQFKKVSEIVNQGGLDDNTLNQLEEIKGKVKSEEDKQIIGNLISEINKIREEIKLVRESAVDSGQFSVQDKLNMAEFLSNIVLAKIKENEKGGIGADYEKDLKNVSVQSLSTLLKYIPKSITC